MECMHGMISALQQLCPKRALGEPLHHILDSQPSGPLELLYKKGVRVPSSVYSIHTPLNLKKVWTSLYSFPRKRSREYRFREGYVYGEVKGVPEEMSGANCEVIQPCRLLPWK